MEGNLGRLQRLVGRAWGEAKGPLYRNAIFIMLSSVVGSGLGLFFWIIVSFVYTNPDDPGYALALNGASTFLGGIGGLGLSVGILRFLPETEEKVPLLNAALTFTGVGCIALSLAFIAGLPLWGKDLYFVLASPVYPVIFILTTMAYGFSSVLDGAAFAMRRADIPTWRTVLFAVIKIPLPLGLALGLSLTGRLGVFLSIALAFSVSVVLEAYVFLPRIIPGYRPRPRWSRRRIRPMLQFSLGNWTASGIGSAGSMLLPLLILNTLGTASNATYFYVATVVASLLYIIPGATMTSFFAEASHRNTDRRGNERKAVLLSLGLLVPGIIVMWLFARIVLSLFGDPVYADKAVDPLRVLVFASIPVFLNGLFTTRIRIQKRSRPLIIASAIATAVTLGVGYVLLLNFGLHGLAYAVVLGQAAATPYFYAVGRAPVELEPIETIPVPP